MCLGLGIDGRRLKSLDANIFLQINLSYPPTLGD